MTFAEKGQQFLRNSLQKLSLFFQVFISLEGDSLTRFQTASPGPNPNRGSPEGFIIFAEIFKLEFDSFVIFVSIRSFKCERDVIKETRVHK